MNAEEYMTRFQAQLKGISPNKQMELVEEIAMHLSEGQSDPHLGKDALVREQRLEMEMGAPEDLGRRMQNIHRQNRWMDYLLVILPALVLSPLIYLVLLWLSPAAGTAQLDIPTFLYSSIRFQFLLHLVLIGIAIRRYQRFGSPGLAVFWLAETWWSVMALFLREQRWRIDSVANLTGVGMIETLFWLAVLFGLGFAFVRMVIGARDVLIVALGLLPLTVAIGNLITVQMMTSGSFPYGYDQLNWIPGFFGPTQMVLLVWPALFFLFRARPVRWLGLLVHAVPISYRYTGLIVLWSLPMVMVLACWMVDWWNKKQSKKALVE